MGGYIALSLLQNYPHRVSGLILSDTQPSADSIKSKQQREVQAKEVLQEGTSKLLAGFVSKSLSRSAANEVRMTLRQMVDRQTAFAIASALLGMGVRADSTKTLTETAVPILIITGEEDILIPPKNSETMYSLAKNSHLIRIANAGHLSSLEQPKEWNKAVIKQFYKPKI